MLAFIKRHWIVYVLGTVLACALGWSAARFVGEKASTPAEVRNERIAAEKENAAFLDSLSLAGESTDTASTDVLAEESTAESSLVAETTSE